MELSSHRELCLLLLTKQWSRRGETKAPFVDVISPRGSLLSFGF
jgi:hypothetical protein